MVTPKFCSRDVYFLVTMSKAGDDVVTPADVDPAHGPPAAGVPHQPLPLLVLVVAVIVVAVAVIVVAVAAVAGHGQGGVASVAWAWAW